MLEEYSLSLETSKNRLNQTQIALTSDRVLNLNISDDLVRIINQTMASWKKLEEGPEESSGLNPKGFRRDSIRATFKFKGKHLRREDTTYTNNTSGNLIEEITPSQDDDIPHFSILNESGMNIFLQKKSIVGEGEGATGIKSATFELQSGERLDITAESIGNFFGKENRFSVMPTKISIGFELEYGYEDIENINMNTVGTHMHYLTYVI